MMSMKKNIKKYIIISVAAIFAIYVFIANNNSTQGISVEVAYPQRGTIVERIPANGKVQPVIEVKISPDVSGEIIELNVEEGDNIKKGELLVKIRQDIYISAVERAEASLNAVKAQYLQQKAQVLQTELSFKRDNLLYSQKAISEAEYENSISQYNMACEELKVSQYNIKSAEAALKEAKENLTKTIIYAPITGVVSKLYVEKGERVVGTSQMAGTEIMRIADFDAMEVLVDVNENDIVKLNISDTAYVAVEAYPNRKFTGVVTHIANSAKNTGVSAGLDEVTNFEVHVSIHPSSYKDLLLKDPIPFRPGMSASVEIETQRKNNALIVPLQSVTARDDVNSDTTSNTFDLTANRRAQYIFVYDRLTSQVLPKIVTTGIQDMKSIVIESGITDSTLFVTGPYSAVTRSLKSGSYVNAKMNLK